jgi:hypothetical protein
MFFNRECSAALPVRLPWPFVVYAILNLLFGDIWHRARCFGMGSHSLSHFCFRQFGTIACRSLLLCLFFSHPDVFFVVFLPAGRFKFVCLSD